MNSTSASALRRALQRSEHLDSRAVGTIRRSAAWSTWPRDCATRRKAGRYSSTDDFARYLMKPWRSHLPARCRSKGFAQPVDAFLLVGCVPDGCDRSSGLLGTRTWLTIALAILRRPLACGNVDMRSGEAEVVKHRPKCEDRRDPECDCSKQLRRHAGKHRFPQQQRNDRGHLRRGLHLADERDRNVACPT